MYICGQTPNCMSVIINLYDPEASGIVEFGFVSSPFGKCLAAFTSQGLCQFEFIEDSRRAVERLREKWYEAWVNHNALFDGIDFAHFLSGNRTLPFPLCLQGTPFQIEVWKTLLNIPFGKTLTYSEVAYKMGRPRSVRAVASAIAANPLGIVIPCHRVIRSDGNYGQYRWGSDRKRDIIEWEKSNSQICLLSSPNNATKDIRPAMAAYGASL